jgi:hypothetical protein
MKLIPQAIFKAPKKLKFCLIKMKVSRPILVSKPLIIAKIIMPKIEKGI